MADTLVSVRMPASLVDALKELVREDHYLDLSEEIRSIVRHAYTTSLHPELLEVQRLRTEIANAIKQREQRSVTKKVLEELEHIKREVKESA